MGRAFARPPLEPAGFVLGVLALLLAVSTAPFVIRALRKTAGARVFDAVHALVVVPICLIGLSAGAEQATSLGFGAMGTVMIAAGAGLYWLGFVRVLPQQGAGRNFYTGTSVALAYVVVGVSQLLPGRRPRSCFRRPPSERCGGAGGSAMRCSRCTRRCCWPSPPLSADLSMQCSASGSDGQMHGPRCRSFRSWSWRHSSARWSMASRVRRRRPGG